MTTTVRLTCKHCNTDNNLPSIAIHLSLAKDSYVFVCVVCAELNIVSARQNTIEILQVAGTGVELSVPVLSLPAVVVGYTDSGMSHYDEGILRDLQMLANCSMHTYGQYTKGSIGITLYQLLVAYAEDLWARAIAPWVWKQAKVRVIGEPKSYRGIVQGLHIFPGNEEYLLTLATSTRKSRQVRLAQVELSDIESIIIKE